MEALYNIAIRAYYFSIIIASLFNRKAKLWVEGRKNIFHKINAEIKSGEELVWFHCASLGEFEQGRPLIERFRSTYPDFKIVLTFFSPSGYEVKKNYSGVDYLFYLPLDTKVNVGKFIEAVNPKVAFFVKYEFWFNYLSILKKKNIPTYLVSGIFRENQHFFKWYGGWYRKQLNNFSHFFLQNGESQLLLNSIGITNTSISGDTRFDRVCTIAETIKPIPNIELFKQDQKILIAGSTWIEDEKLLTKLLDRIQLANYNLKLIIAPHEVSETRINSLLSLLAKGNRQIKVCKYSLFNESIAKDTEVLIIDNIGMLSSLYQYADIAYIGGGFGKGIHNIPEAAVFGMPVIFGPNYKRFREAIDLLKLGGAFGINSYEALEQTVKQMLENKIAFEKASEICKNYVTENKGATEKIMKAIKWNFL